MGLWWITQMSRLAVAVKKPSSSTYRAQGRAEGGQLCHKQAASQRKPANIHDDLPQRRFLLFCARKLIMCLTTKL